MISKKNKHHHNTITTHRHLESGNPAPPAQGIPTMHVALHLARPFPRGALPSNVVALKSSKKAEDFHGVERYQISYQGKHLWKLNWKQHICKLWDGNRNAWNILEKILYCLFLCCCLWGPHAQQTALDLDSTLALTWEGHTKGQDVAAAGTAIQITYDSMYAIMMHVFFILPIISEKILHACIPQWSAGVSWNNFLKTRYHVTIVLGNDELFGLSFLLASQSEVQQGHLARLPLLLFYYPSSLRGNLCSKYTLGYIQYRHLLYPTRACSISSCCVTGHI